MTTYLFGKELFIRFTVRAFRECLSVFVCVSFPFGFEGAMWDLIILVSEHCISFYFTSEYTIRNIKTNRIFQQH